MGRGDGPAIGRYRRDAPVFLSERDAFDAGDDFAAGRLDAPGKQGRHVAKAPGRIPIALAQPGQGGNDRRRLAAPDKRLLGVVDGAVHPGQPVVVQRRRRGQGLFGEQIAEQQLVQVRTAFLRQLKLGRDRFRRRRAPAFERGPDGLDLVAQRIAEKIEMVGELPRAPPGGHGKGKGVADDRPAGERLAQKGLARARHVEKKDVGAVVEDHAVECFRAQKAADPVGAFEDQTGPAGLGQPDGAGQPGDAAADNDNGIGIHGRRFLAQWMRPGWRPARGPAYPRSGVGVSFF